MLPFDTDAAKATFVAARLKEFRTPGRQFVQHLSDGRWLQVQERLSQSGHLVGVRTDVSELKQAEQRIKHQAERDALTGLASTLQELHDIGVGIALDDFGTGYASLSHLKQFPIDSLKIDQSFVRDMTSDNDDSVIARTVISLAHSLGMSVVAEGVETEEQFRFLSNYGCDFIQGYLIGRPMFLDEAKAYLIKISDHGRLWPSLASSALDASEASDGRPQKRCMEHAGGLAPEPSRQI